MDKILAARLAKALSVTCVRNTFLEDLHAGISPGPPHQNRRAGTHSESDILKASELLRYIFACFHEICGRFSHRQ